MLRLIGLLIGLGWVVVGWRNLPPMTERSALTVGFAFGVTCWLTYLYGRSATRAEATAIANARAEAKAAAMASSQSAAVGNVFVLNSEQGARAVAAQEFAGLEGATWIGGDKPVLEQDVAEQVLEDIGEELAYEREG